MKREFKIKEGIKQFAHINVPYNEQTRELLFEKKIQRYCKVSKDGRYIDTTILSMELEEIMKDIGFDLEVVYLEKDKGIEQILNYEVVVSKYPHAKNPKEISIFFGAKTQRELLSMKKEIISYIKEHVDVLIHHDAWIDNCEMIL